VVTEARQALGKKGEAAARAYLERHGKSDIREVVGTLEYPGEPKHGTREPRARKIGGTP